MKNSEHQLLVIKNLLDSISNRLAMSDYRREALDLSESSIEFIDKLADLLNRPEIADLWDDKEGE